MNTERKLNISCNTNSDDVWNIPRGMAVLSMPSHEWDEFKRTETSTAQYILHILLPILVHNQILKPLDWIISLRSRSPHYLQSVPSHTSQHKNFYPKHFSNHHGVCAVTIHNCALTAVKVNWGSFNPDGTMKPGHFWGVPPFFQSPL